MQQIRIQQQADAGFREAGKLEQTGSLLTETGTADIQAVQEPGPSIPLQQGQAELAEQPEDEFYRESPYLKLFSRKDLDRLEWINGVQREGDTYMSRARNAERKAEEWKVRADGAQNASQQRKFLSKLKKEEEDALKRKMQAVDYYQVANENKYLLFNDIIEEGKASVNHPDRSERVGIFLDRARSQYTRAQEIRQEALKKGDLKERYQGLVEANAYEIVTLENQKFAFMSLAGVPLPENVAVTSQTKTAEIPGNVGTAQEVAGIARPVSTQNQTTEAKEPVKQQAGSETTPPPAEAVSTEPPSRTAEQKVPVQEAANIPEKTVSGSSAVPAKNNMPAPWYRIQMGVFSTPKEEAYFRGLGPVTTEPVPGKEMTRYFVGGWPYYEEAGNTLARARREGFDQAFIVATLEGKRIALSKARSLENTAQQPATPEPSTIDWEVTQGARPVYKIQVGAFRGDPSDEMKETYRKLAAGEAVEKITNELGITLYTIGNFYTFEEAVRFRNRLAANGLKDCFVTAFLEGRKISVPEARKMTGK